jgi:phosphoribosylcarboxyaminoimidazole (NCAIR) mutase
MGARNAGHLAAQIIALGDDDVAAAVTEQRARMRETARPPAGFSVEGWDRDDGNSAT